MLISAIITQVAKISTQLKVDLRCVCVRDLILKKKTLSQNKIHFIQKVNEIWYLRSSTSWIRNVIDFLYKMVEWRAIQDKCVTKIISQ